MNEEGVAEELAQHLSAPNGAVNASPLRRAFCSAGLLQAIYTARQCRACEEASVQ